MVLLLRNIRFWVKSKLFHRVIVYNPDKRSKIIQAQSKSKTDPLFFLYDRKINYVPQVSITHNLAFSRLKIFDSNMETPVDPATMVANVPKDIFDPPKEVRGMTSLDITKFDKTIKVPCIRAPVTQIQGFKDVLSKYQLKLPKFSPVVDLERDDPKRGQYKLLLLNPLLVTDKFLTTYRFEEKGSSLEEHELKLTYSNWDFNTTINAIIPEDMKVSGFTQVGQIAHFNLRNEVLPFKYLIGQILLDKQPGVMTVVNKTDTIDNTYRNFKMELLAGEDNFIAQARENGCVFELDFSKVYWNSRLGTEHGRLVKLIKEGDIVFDVFAGIGPFAIPAARKRAVVFANDLNPASYESLLKNIELNKVKVPVKSYNMDGREFIQTVVKDELTKFYSQAEESVFVTPPKVHIIMNLPAIAVTFLDAFKGLLEDVSNLDLSKVKNLPTVHCYCFTNLEEASEKFDSDKSKEVKNRVVGVVGLLQEDDITLRFVRDVAPNKEMMCATFQLTPAILSGKSVPDTGKAEIDTQKMGEDKGSEEMEEAWTALEGNGEPPRKVQKTAEQV